MGAFDDVSPITIPRSEDERKRWRWEAHEQVVIKGTITVADQEYVTDRYGKSGKNGSVEVQMGKGRFALLDRMIMSWTFLKSGQPVPVNTMTIRRLPATYSNAILEVIDGLTQSMSEEEQEDFLASANGHTVDGSRSENLSLMSL
jgi:hypothetical protein